MLWLAAGLWMVVLATYAALRRLPRPGVDWTSPGHENIGPTLGRIGVVVLGVGLTAAVGLALAGASGEVVLLVVLVTPAVWLLARLVGGSWLLRRASTASRSA
jgi:hypothetical protein